ncbi:MAG: hypothetical protein FJZ47_22555 [Candidatus Tectomicrobia bacterium]|uniref:Uncharacterized protein n=1 Tax=Tectimicrobiota bacterium TaxID=2528274 RepID=A0A937W7D5_UNCTE|nr:hypothetical protein [Candidatus Tectomicrobia bacterium]
MRLCMISDDSLDQPTPERLDLSAVEQQLVALGHQGHDITWLMSPAQALTLRQPARLTPQALTMLPPCCRHVIPVELYHYAGLRLVCVPEAFWRQTDLHTRLFTFLCLLQRAAPAAVFHAWGSTLTSLYLTVYTARFLAVPAVVSYTDCHLATTRFAQPFLWGWIAQHLAAAVVSTRTAQTLLQACGIPASLLTPAQPAAHLALVALYQEVCSSASPGARAR